MNPSIMVMMTMMRMMRMRIMIINEYDVVG